MARDPNIKVCRYAKCRHESKEIDTSKDAFVQSGSSFYHEDCYRDKSNIDFIVEFWKNEIDPAVVYVQLRAILNRLVFENNYPSDYVAWAIQYCVKNKRKLQHPPGIKYVLENDEIKKAYKNKDKPVVKPNDSCFSARNVEEDAPKFKVKVRRTGFGSALGKV